LKTSSLFREKAITFIFTAGIAVIFIIAVLPSCKDDVQTVISLDVVDTLPELTA